MAINRGKQFEEKFKHDFSSIKNSSLDRLYDTTNGYKSISNICDFIGYVYPNIFYLEVKTIKGNTFPLTNLSQYNKMQAKVGIPGVRVGVVIWFSEHDRIIYVPIATITKMKNDGKKSVNIRTIHPDEYVYVEIPCSKNRVLVTGCYDVLTQLKEGE